MSNETSTAVMTAKTHQPTPDEAVEIVLHTLTRQQRRTLLHFWQAQPGSEFAETVKIRVQQRWKNKKYQANGVAL